MLSIPQEKANSEELISEALKTRKSWRLAPSVPPPLPEVGRNRDAAFDCNSHRGPSNGNIQRYIPHDEFVAALETVVGRLNNVLAEIDAPYAVMLDPSPHKSRYWVYRLAAGMLTRAPEMVIYSTPKYDPPAPHLEAFRHVVVFDDVILSGEQLGVSASFLPPDAHLYATTAFRSFRNDPLYREIEPSRVTLLGETLAPETIAFFDHCIPDNVSRKYDRPLKNRPYNDPSTSEAFMDEEELLFKQGGFDGRWNQRA